MGERGKDWRTILLAVASLGSALLAFALGILLTLYAVLGFVRSEFSQDGPSPIQAILLASALIFVGLTFLPSAYYSIERLRGRDMPPANPKIISLWQCIPLILFWIGISMLAQSLMNQSIWKWLTPPLYLLAIATPVYLLVRLATGGLNAGSIQRFWGVPAVGMALGTTLAVTAEAFLALIGLLGLGLYLGFHPEQLVTLRQIASQLTNASDIEQTMNIAAPWLKNPFAVILSLLFFSVFVPLVEESAKSIATWTIYDRLDSPAQGFVAGALSGAGFGLVESLLASATPDSSWAYTLMIRGASTMMHIMAASLTGWGIASFRARKETRTLIGSYVLAIALHGLWNAAVILLAFGGLRTSLNFNISDPVSLAMMFLGGSILILLCLAIPLILGMVNMRLRTPQAPASPLPAQIKA